ncbi:MAG: ATP-binding cassette domain-containing protein [Lachnospiraceae bacterium]|nr:ATP-binding cassette domain-containing protein [Lachnospiraceae bacterium]
MGDSVDNRKNDERGARRVLRALKKPAYLLISIAAWILLWQYAADRLDKSVLLPRPGRVLKAFAELVKSERFGTILRSSLLHIAVGFAAALVIGCLLAVLCRFSDLAAAIMIPPMKLVKTVPVVSFIILLLLWVKPERISVVISFLIVLPVVYENVSRGVRETPESMVDMARIFRVPLLRRLRFLYLPNAVPYATAAVSSGLSLCWKAGIAAEIIGLSKDSIGRQLYDAKLYLDTENLFAWTIVVILVSVVMEWLIMIVFRALMSAIADPTLWYHPGRLVRYLLGFRTAAGRESAEAEVAGSENAPTDETENVATDNAEREIAKADAGEATEPGTAKSVAAAKSAAPGEILAELRGIGKNYNGRAVLSDVSMTVRRGEVWLVTGASGSGKTTLLRCLTGLAKPDSGEVAYPGGRKRLGMVFQEDRLCEGFAAWKNVAMVMPGRASSHREEILRMLAECGIEDGVTRSVGAFSGGMKRRTAWVRALCAAPELLILDEPFTGLDAARKDQLLGLLQLRAKKCGIVLVTHNASEIEKICSVFDNVRRLEIGSLESPKIE